MYKFLIRLLRSLTSSPPVVVVLSRCWLPALLLLLLTNCGQPQAARQYYQQYQEKKIEVIEGASCTISLGAYLKRSEFAQERLRSSCLNYLRLE